MRFLSSACPGWVAANDVLALNKPEKTATITITNDDSFGDVAEKLKDEGLIEYKFLFNLFATFTRSKDDVVAGTFTLNTDMDYRALLSGMSANSATRATVTVTIPEGYTVDQIFTLLEEKGVASVEDLQDMAANHDYAFSFLQDLEMGDYHRLEGYLYPDTYEFTTPQNSLYVINKMLVRFDEQFTDAMRQEVADSGRTIHEIITIASMIEKETDGNDRADIASVIYNRLNNPRDICRSTPPWPISTAARCLLRRTSPLIPPTTPTSTRDCLPDPSPTPVWSPSRQL